MKSEPKAFASLSSGLLARKGAARPAMRPQGFGQAAAGLEDLGWNDMGFEPPRPALTPVRDDEHDAFGDQVPPPPLRSPLAGLTPVQSPVHDQHAEIAGRLAVNDGEEEQDDSPAPEAIGEEEIDETAELYEPEAEAEPEIEAEPAIAAAPVATFVAPAPLQSTAPAPRHAARPRRAPTVRAAPGLKGKAAFTLRLDSERHLKLRLACAVSASSAQILVTQALDALLSGMPELDAMAAKANRKG